MCPHKSIFLGIFLDKTLKIHVSSTVRAFDIIAKLRAKQKYQLSSGHKSTRFDAIHYVAGMLSQSTTLG